jgi:predicted nucleotidyltransferase
MIGLAMRLTTSKEEYLIPGHNGLETCVILSETRFFAERRSMQRETVKDVLRRFNENGVRYCLVGGLALAHHAIPRRTEDMDIMVLQEDLPLVQQLLKGYEQRGTAVVLIFQVGETRIDIIPATLRAKRAAVLGAIESMMDDLPVKVASLRDMILMKVWAAPERPEMGKRMQDETDVVGLIELNREQVSAEDIAYICRTLLGMAYTVEQMSQARAQVEWLNGVLEKLGLSDRRFPLVN